MRRGHAGHTMSLEQAITDALQDEFPPIEMAEARSRKKPANPCSNRSARASSMSCVCLAMAARMRRSPKSCSFRLRPSKCIPAAFTASSTSAIGRRPSSKRRNSSCSKLRYHLNTTALDAEYAFGWMTLPPAACYDVVMATSPPTPLQLDEGRIGATQVPSPVGEGISGVRLVVNRRKTLWNAYLEAEGTISCVN